MTWLRWPSYGMNRARSEDKLGPIVQAGGTVVVRMEVTIGVPEPEVSEAAYVSL